MVMAEATNHYFKHLGVSDGLSQVCIPSIYQDELGAVWLGTTEGLNRYNGKDVKVFQPSESNHGLTNNEINELCGDKNGRMYIRSGNDLIKLDIYTEQFTCLRQKGVYGLFCKKDTLWVSCADGIYYYTGQGLCSCAERFCGKSTLCGQRDCMGGYQKILGRNIT